MFAAFRFAFIHIKLPASLFGFEGKPSPVLNSYVKIKVIPGHCDTGTNRSRVNLKLLKLM